MLYQPTVHDMLATLPPADRAELITLIGAAGDSMGNSDTETGGTP